MADSSSHAKKSLAVRFARAVHERVEVVRLRSLIPVGEVGLCHAVQLLQLAEVRCSNQRQQQMVGQGGEARLG